jgi:hypothetical protein
MARRELLTMVSVNKGIDARVPTTVGLMIRDEEADLLLANLEFTAEEWVNLTAGSVLVKQGDIALLVAAKIDETRI